MAVEWRKPTAEEARLFAKLLEAGADPEAALGAVDPELMLEVLPELSRRWQEQAIVRAARFDLRQWADLAPAERMHQALERTHMSMACYLAMHPIAGLTGEKHTKGMKYVEVLQAVIAGTAGRGDATSRFFEDVLAGKIKLQSPEVIQ